MRNLTNLEILFHKSTVSLCWLRILSTSLFFTGFFFAFCLSCMLCSEKTRAKKYKRLNFLPKRDAGHCMVFTSIYSRFHCFWQFHNLFHDLKNLMVNSVICLFIFHGCYSLLFLIFYFCMISEAKTFNSLSQLLLTISSTSGWHGYRASD